MFYYAREVLFKPRIRLRHSPLHSVKVSNSSIDQYEYDLPFEGLFSRD